MPRSQRLLAVLAAAALPLGLTACGDAAQPAGQGGKIPVVVPTNVWGSVVAAVGGDQVAVNPVIDDPTADPHSYQAAAADVADVADADLVLYNGGGYDDFFAKMAEQAPDVRKLVAFDISGKRAGHAHEHAGGHGHGHGGANEHVWYDLPTVARVADQVATQLGELRPQARQTFAGNAEAFTARLGELTERVRGIAAQRGGGEVLATEPVAHYLLDAAKLTDVTPPEFAEAIEEESDIPVAAQQQVNELIAGKRVDAVVHNPQTVTPVTERLVGSARQAGVPVVEVTETLPAGSPGYIAWMSAQVDALSGALIRS